MESRVHEVRLRDGRSAIFAEKEVLGLDEVSSVVGGLSNWADSFALASWVDAEAHALSYGLGMEEAIDQKADCNPAVGLSVLSTSAAAQPVTFSRDVAPILFEHCVSCHRPGEIGPMPLITYEQTRPWGKAMVDAIRSGKMPPWCSKGHERNGISFL